MPVFAQFAARPAMEAASEGMVQRQMLPIRDKLVSGSTATSTNWSGYAVTGTNFTSANASWTVPSVVCSGLQTRTSYAAAWVGIDGYSSSTVEQTGTLSDCANGRPVYYAWYEFYPAALTTIPSITVNPGDVITASVSYANSSFTTTITDVTTGKTFTTSSAVAGAQRTSAEWIMEAPCCTASGGILPLADFGTINFGPTFTSQSGTDTATDGSNSGTINSFGSSNIIQITKTPSLTSLQKSTCSVLSNDGASFSCTWSR